MARDCGGAATTDDLVPVADHELHGRAVGQDEGCRVVAADEVGKHAVDGGRDRQLPGVGLRGRDHGEAGAVGVAGGDDRPVVRTERGEPGAQANLGAGDHLLPARAEALLVVGEDDREALCREVTDPRQVVARGAVAPAVQQEDGGARRPVGAEDVGVWHARRRRVQRGAGAGGQQRVDGQSREEGAHAL